uniref:KH and NYN domain containing n=1 Tax=Neolamprologus brichardi TaxID=32507 RepID=A0A3Q4I9K6_NEOBR
MDDERSDGGGGEAELEDEFACAGMLRGSLTSLHSTVERIFSVAFSIGADDLPHGSNGQIWLKLRGPSTNVKAAKLFVKGVVNQEEQQEIKYPGVLHCVFCGAKGLFMDSLIKSTSAHIVGSPGFLLISGLVEPVVRAYSLITDLVERYEGTQSKRMGDGGSGESLDSRRAFKTLVEKWEDRHILDLLVLPGSVKEILLDLVKETGLGSSPSSSLTDVNTEARPHGDSEDRSKIPSALKQTVPDSSTTTERWAEGMAAGAGNDFANKDSFQAFSMSAGTRGRAEGAEERPTHSPQEVGEEHLGQATASGKEKEQELQLSMGNKEFWLLLKFFTAMGYTEEVVKRVLARTGPKEASQILDLVQQEQDRSDQEQRNRVLPNPKREDAVDMNQTEKNRPCETEHREDGGEIAGGGGAIRSDGETEEGREGEDATGDARHNQGKVSADVMNKEQEEDFVLGVLKKAAASCGYPEQNVTKLYNLLPDGSTHQLLLQLQKEGVKEAGAFREGPREMDDVVLDTGGSKLQIIPELQPYKPPEEREFDGREKIRVSRMDSSVPIEGRDIWNNEPQQSPVTLYTSQQKQHQPSKSQTPHHIILPGVKGPPMPTYASSMDPQLTNFQSHKQQGNTNYLPNPSPTKQNHHAQNNGSKHSFKQALQAPQPLFPGTKDSSPTRARDKRGFASTPSVVVTGEQRFLESLQIPFELKLTDHHGLGHFFSCRGIALAVQHFWDRGHRQISALIPQWRQKSDPRVKEKHYLTELQQLGLLSYTYCFKTGGVIVTNDNLRDLLDESPVWRDIIKKSLLQYTFVGDHFMVPDDPLGRGGPHLDDFLQVINFRDRTLGGALDALGAGGRGRGRGQGKGWDMGQKQKQYGATGHGQGVRAERSPDETANLREQLCQVFPNQDNMVTLVLQCHSAETDINVLSDLILEQQSTN